MSDIIKCKDCKYFECWRTPEQAEKFGQIYECEKYVITNPSPDDYCSKAEKVERHSNNNHCCNTCEFKHLESECLGCAEYDEHDNLIDLRNYKAESEEN